MVAALVRMSGFGQREISRQRPTSGALPPTLVDHAKGSFPGAAAQNLPFRFPPSRDLRESFDRPAGEGFVLAGVGPIPDGPVPARNSE